jgi:hypothetical protein
LKNRKFKTYKTIILPVVWYGYETWYLILWKEHRLKVVENRELKGIFSSKSGEIIEACRKMNDEEHRVEERKNLEDLCIDGKMY